MARLEKVDGDTWREFLAAPVAVLMLGKRDCAACASWTEELEAFLATDTEWPQARFGKMILDEGRLFEFKRASPWLREVDELPFTQIYVAGVPWKSFAGGGTERLVSRLRKLPRAADTAERKRASEKPA